MKKFILDCSAVMSWCFSDKKSKASDAILQYLSDTEALVPAHWPLEVSNVLLVAERKKKLTRMETDRFIAIISLLPITVDTKTHRAALQSTLALAREHRLSSYGAAYLDLAVKEGLPLATLDKDLKKAAIQMGVGLV